MEPTNRLRFVERAVPAAGQVLDKPHMVKIRILQQWWEDAMEIDYPDGSRAIQRDGEWRDVPLEKE